MGIENKCMDSLLVAYARTNEEFTCTFANYKLYAMIQMQRGVLLALGINMILASKFHLVNTVRSKCKGLADSDAAKTQCRIFTAVQPAPATTSASDAMSILDTITSLNQEASVRAISGTDRGRKGQTGNESLHLLSEDSQQDMSLIREADSQRETKMETDEASQDTLEVKQEDTGELTDLSRDGVTEEFKMEEGELGPEELKEEEKDKVSGKLAGKLTEEKEDEDQQRSASQAKQRARERIKEGESL